jgi:hypothetical protein
MAYRVTTKYITEAERLSMASNISEADAVGANGGSSNNSHNNSQGAVKKSGAHNGKESLQPRGGDAGDADDEDTEDGAYVNDPYRDAY